MGIAASRAAALAGVLAGIVVGCGSVPPVGTLPMRTADVHGDFAAVELPEAGVAGAIAKTARQFALDGLDLAVTGELAKAVRVLRQAGELAEGIPLQGLSAKERAGVEELQQRIRLQLEGHRVYTRMQELKAKAKAAAEASDPVTALEAYDGLKKLLEDQDTRFFDEHQLASRQKLIDHYKRKISEQVHALPRRIEEELLRPSADDHS